MFRPETTYTHQSGCLAEYDDSLLAIGSYYSGDRNKVELLQNDTWIEQENHPKNLALFGCIKIDTGVITVGGFNVLTNKPYDDVFFFQSSSWRSLGKILTPQFYSAVYSVGGKIFSVLGGKSPYNIEKFRLLAGNVTDNEVIFTDFRLDAPIVFEAEIDFCLN